MDTNLFYREKGEGEPLILLHGNGEDHSYFINQIEYFSSFYRVIAIDTRGHGKSPVGDAPFTLSQFSEDLNSFFIKMNIEKAHILGFSDGGNIAVLFSLKYPEKVKSLILNGANIYPSGLKLSVLASVVFSWLALGIICLFDKKKIHLKNLYFLMVKEPHINPEELKQIHVPTLVIVGENDMIKSSHSKLISKCIENSQLATVGKGHFIANEYSDVFNEKVHDFLKNQIY